MLYKNFNNIAIGNETGVSPVGEDTKLIAKYIVGESNVQSVLDVGTGASPSSSAEPIETRLDPQTRVD